MFGTRATLLGVVVSACLCGCEASGTHHAVSVTSGTPDLPTGLAPSRTTQATISSASHTPIHRRRRSRPHHRPPDPGALPQTTRLPSSSTRAFHAEMNALWSGIGVGSVTPALPAFFPERAYDQVKAIGDPEADYEYRLVADYRLDIEAAHQLLGVHAHRARLIAVLVPAGDAHWVQPGACYNQVGYYEVPNSRVVYRHDGQTRSFGIASMISWRGVWYVVHLGAVDRAAADGVVDDPTEGTGAPVPSTTC